MAEEGADPSPAEESALAAAEDSASAAENGTIEGGGLMVMFFNFVHVQESTRTDLSLLFRRKARPLSRRSLLLQTTAVTRSGEI